MKKGINECDLNEISEEILLITKENNFNIMDYYKFLNILIDKGQNEGEEEEHELEEKEEKEKKEKENKERKEKEDKEEKEKEENSKFIFFCH